MKITEIQVRGLFGTYDHDIPLTFQGRVTIVHGPNGVGKTMMLKMIAALIEGRIAIFERVPFREFKVLLDNNAQILVRHREQISTETGRTAKIEIIVTDHTGNQSSSAETSVPPEVPKHILDLMDHRIPSPYSRSGAGWVDRTTGVRFSVDQIIDRFPNVAEHLPVKYRSIPLAMFEDLDVFFVETTRLEAEKTTYRSDSKDEFNPFSDEEVVRPQLRVEQYSSDIVRRIKSALGDYARNSQDSDRTFPERLVHFVRNGENALSEKDILKRMSELEAKRQRLISLGFLDSETGLRGLGEEDVQRVAEALTIYVKDVQLKLAVFDDLADRVGRLIDIVNDRFKNKTLTLHRELGLKLQSTTGQAINLEDLSSGEQHELVVLYELLFRSPKAGLVLVDEPEISSHVAWQSRFLPDLMGILELTNSYSIVATHSPVIIGPRWDITKELGGPSMKKDGVEHER